MVGEEGRWNPNRVSNGRYALTSSSSFSSSTSASSSSSSSSSCLSLSPDLENGGECGLEGMELEAARALACMSRTAVREIGGRRLKRFKSRSPARDWENSNQGWDLASVPEDNKSIKVAADEKIKVEQISELLPPCSNCSSNSPSCSGRKTKLNLTEAEREARRMRRVLANRESARQTIRRRQALRDDLRKKVSDLSLDNQNMKMEKGQITKKYMSLRNKNKQLKTELAMAIACNIMGAESTSTPPETLSSPNDNSFLVNFKPPFMPGFCPPWPVRAAAHSEMIYDQSKATESHNDQNQIENSATHSHSPLKDEVMKFDKSHRLDIDLNSSSVIPEASLEVFAEQTAKFLDAASARRRRKEILKLKHLCGRPIVLHI